jgi:predicted nucleic acid-binding protein
MRKVVCNTTPIISLLKIERLDLLENLYSTVIVPGAVWQEIEQGRNGPFYTDLRSLPYIVIQSVGNTAAVDYLTDLDRGEAEVIVLAREISADLVIIDEEVGRAYARHFNLTLTGTLGILLRAKQDGFIPAIKPLLEKLIESGVWISKWVFDDVMALACEE